MSAPQKPPAAAEIYTQPVPASAETGMRRVRIGIGLALSGLLIFLIGIRPGWFGLVHQPGMGFVKISVMLIGLALICLGGYVGQAGVWRNAPRSILADIGLRLVATGYVITFFSAMADFFRIGAQSSPHAPSFGPWQTLGVEAGEAVIAIGFLLAFLLHSTGKKTV